jgi:predicted regulator of Ras-like GTPase activity (Roadblock/LC7/MglB family)
MKIPFIDLYEKLRARFSGAGPSAQHCTPVVPAAKKGSSLSKTVLPNMTRKIAATPDPLQVAAGVVTKAASQAAGRDEPVSIVAPIKPRGSSPTPKRGAQLKSDRAISLRLSDVVDRLPPELIKPRESFDAERGILLQASEIEKGMATGNPAVSLTTLYQQAPEIFLHTLPASDSTLVRLPFDKVLAQFMSLQVRPDQVRDDQVPHLETPILQVTLEDKDRFGTTIEPLESSPLPPVRVEPATAQTLAAAEPEPTATAIAKPPPSRPPIPLVAKPEASPSKAPAPISGKKIPFDLPPNGTGASASERVPALSGPPVPNTLPPTPTPSAIPVKVPPPTPPPIPLKVPAPCNDIRPKFIRIPGVEPGEEPISVVKPSSAKRLESTIAVKLLAILEELPPFQLNGSPSGVPEDVRVQFPLSLIEPQLASGRVVVAAKILQKAMPEAYRHLLKSDTAETPITLPLHEVLKHLPATVLRMRDDQEAPVVPEKVETPISVAADEDAKRLAQADAPTAEPSKKPVEESQPKEPAPTAKGDVESEQRLDARTVLARANALPGVAGCAITFADGLSLAGNLPADLRADGLCAMAASLLQKIDNHLHEPNIGPLIGITLHATKSLTFQRRDNVVLAALHVGGDLPSETRDQLASLVEKLSHTYSESEATHVHH